MNYIKRELSPLEEFVLAKYDTITDFSKAINRNVGNTRNYLANNQNITYATMCLYAKALGTTPAHICELISQRNLHSGNDSR